MTDRTSLITAATFLATVLCCVAHQPAAAKMARGPEPVSNDSGVKGWAPLDNSWRNDGPVNIVFDTDMGNDIDDVLALAMIHALEDRGAIKLLAVTVTKDHELAAPFVDALNTYYCRPDIPIGVVRGGLSRHPGKFLKLLEEKDSRGKPVFPHDLKNGRDAPDALPLLRRLLAESPDNSVVFVQVGFFTNFQRLLETGPDGISSLSGRELVRKKVRLLSLMGGAFQSVEDSNVFREWNVIGDVGEAQKVARDWPTPVIWTGYEAGVPVPFPARSIEADFTQWQHHLVRDAYALHRPGRKDSPTWDLISVVAVTYAKRNYFGLSEPGTVTVENDGFTAFRTSADGRDRFVKVSPEQAIRLQEMMINLVAQPPRSNKCK
jgi:inosine-uridine nucleoside N-ribohydrolase